MVRLCILRFYKGGLDVTLFDLQRPGYSSEINDDEKFKRFTETTYCKKIRISGRLDRSGIILERGKRL